MWKFKKSRRTKSMQKFIKKESLEIFNLCTSETKQHKLRRPNNRKIENTFKCNMQRMMTGNKCYLFVGGDIQVNPGPVNIRNMPPTLQN